MAAILAPLPLAIRAAVSGIALLMSIPSEVLGLGPRLPQTRRLVPERVALDGHSGLFQFGFEMGTGVRTFVTSSTPYAVAGIAALSGSLLYGLLVGLGFGLGRAVVIPVRLLATIDGDSYARLYPSIGRLTSAVCLAIVTVVVALFWRQMITIV